MTGSLATGVFSACSNDDSSTPSGGDAAVTPDGSVGDSGTPEPHNDAMADAASDAGIDSSTGLTDGSHPDSSLSDTGLADTSLLPDTSLVDTGLLDTGLLDTGLHDTGLPGIDSGSDAEVDGGLDAHVEAEAGPQNFCALQSGLAFCADFDEANSLWAVDGGAASVWTSVVGTSTDLSISAAETTSAPDSLLMTAGQGDTPASAKVVKEYGSPVTQAIYEYDTYIASFPTSGYFGGFATDFQFYDVSPTNTDDFGFRIGIFNAQATVGEPFSADFEHNAAVGGCGPCTLSGDAGLSNLPLLTGVWQHVKIAVAFSAAAADAGSPGTVSVQLYLDKSPIAANDMTLPAPFATAPFARKSTGLVDTWTSGNDNWEIYYDNVTLKVQ
jgi:hypothetical protein